MISLKGGWLHWLAWILAITLVFWAMYLGWQRFYRNNSNPKAEISSPKTTIVELRPGDKEAQMPAFVSQSDKTHIRRDVFVGTDIPERPRSDVIEYKVKQGDAVFSIAAEFGITPETILWSNYNVLKDDPHSLSAGMELKIPPTDGVFYQWGENESLEQVAAEFEVDVESILTWPGNRIDLTDPHIETESWVMIPGGQREFQQWIVPVPARGSAGVSTGIYGGGACPGGYDGLYGSGAFIWPSSNRTLSGNDYWSGHLAIDIGSAIGEPIVASDAGVIMFAGWSSGGYGYTVAIDHGNGYQSLYGHLSSVNVSCGQSVSQGQLIGLGGSSGNSTGPHLHFEVRLNGGFVNPWYVLPAP